jgi:hypothetical protein
MKTVILLLSLSSLFARAASADENLDGLRREIEALKSRVTALEEDNSKLKKQIDVERLIVRKELIVSDTGQPWEQGFEAQQIPRGIYARSVGDGVGGLWVRSRLIKGEIDDPFDDRFHALEQDGSRRGSPGHISWNIWLDGAWRQMAIIQGEALEPSEMPLHEMTGENHPGRLRFQTFRPHHNEPLTDALIGQGMMSLGGGGYGGGGLPYAKEVLQLWGGEILQAAIAIPAAPKVVSDDGSRAHQYAIVAVGVQGRRTAASPTTQAKGLAPGSRGTASPAPTPTSSSATGRKSLAHCESRERKKYGPTRARHERAGDANRNGESDVSRLPLRSIRPSRLSGS